ncbi:MAG: NfeD family protein [Rhodospirillaceae bacterium]
MSELEFWHWWVIAAVLGALDMLAQRGFFLWLGVAALIVGLVVFVLSDLSWQIQVLAFAGLAVAMLLVSRQVIRGGGGDLSEGSFSRRGQQFIGRVIVLESAIVNGRGRAFADDTLWTVEGEDRPAGAKVKVVGTDGLLLKVEALDRR